VDQHKSISWALLAVSLAALAGAIVGDVWLWQAGRGWLVLLPVAILALVATIDVLWVRRAWTVRRLAVLDAYAEREIARSTGRQATSPPVLGRRDRGLDIGH
jgi:hypothetical protein